MIICPQACIAIYQSLKYDYMIICPQACIAIYQSLKYDYMIICPQACIAIYQSLKYDYMIICPQACIAIYQSLKYDYMIICPQACVAIYQSLKYDYMIICPQACIAIYQSLKYDYMIICECRQHQKNGKSYRTRLFAHGNIPNSIGVMDSKHIAMFNPKDSGSIFYNYKGFYSVVLLGLVNHCYQYIYANVGCQGISDLIEASIQIIKSPEACPIS